MTTLYETAFTLLRFMYEHNLISSKEFMHNKTAEIANDEFER